MDTRQEPNSMPCEDCHVYVPRNPPAPKLCSTCDFHKVCSCTKHTKENHTI